MKKILLFEPWHLGDVAIALSVCKDVAEKGVQFALACDPVWMDWALTTGVVSQVFPFASPWTMRKKKDKYNPFNYHLKEFIRFRNQVIAYAPDFIRELRGDIRAKFFLNALFYGQIPVKSSNLRSQENVYKRGDEWKRISPLSSVNKPAGTVARSCAKDITVFLGASDPNRAVPLDVAMTLVKSLQREGHSINLILQPTDDIEEIRRITKMNNLYKVKLLYRDFKKMIDCLKKSSLVISTDSGWMHIAYFYGKTTIGLFGFDTVRTWLPPGSHAITTEELYPYSYRYKTKYQFLRPLLNLNIEKVVRLVNKLEGRVVQRPVGIERRRVDENSG